MTRKKYLIGLDNGGSNTKCAIYDLNGHEIAVASASPAIDQPHPGYVERNPEEVWRCNCNAISAAISKAGIDPDEIVSISVSGYGAGIVFIDKDGNATYPIIVSTDSRANAQVKHFINSGAAINIFDITHQQLWAGQPAPLIRWFKENEPIVLEKTRKALPIKDYIRYRLTGEYATEVTDASMLNLVEPKTCSFSDKLFQLSDLEDERDLFDYPVLASDSVAGYITKEAAAETGLKVGTPVAAGLYDVAASTFGSGAIDPGILCVTSGTWTIASYLGSSFENAADSTIATTSCINGRILLEEGSATGTVNQNWYLNNFTSKIYPGLSKKEIYDLVDRIIQSKEPKDTDIIFVPYLYASSTHPDAKGAFCNILGYHREDDMLYAVLEGILMSTMHHIKLLQQSTAPFREIRLSGGVSASKEWSQLFCDIIQLPIVVMNGTQQTARGAAMAAGIAAGEFSDFNQAIEAMCRSEKSYTPNTERADIYVRRFENYEKALQAIDYFASLG